MSYSVIRLSGKAVVIQIEGGGTFSIDALKGSAQHARDFLAWNAKQEVPLDLSDKPPEPPPVDADLERVKAIIAKADADITAGELKELVLKFVRRHA